MSPVSDFPLLVGILLYVLRSCKRLHPVGFIFPLQIHLVLPSVSTSAGIRCMFLEEVEQSMTPTVRIKMIGKKCENLVQCGGSHRHHAPAYVKHRYLLTSCMPSPSAQILSRLISYPRTETDMFEPTMDLVALVREQLASPDWGVFAATLLPPVSQPNPNNGRNTDQAHPPIHPLRYAGDLAGPDKLIYEVRKEAVSLSVYEFFS